MSIQEQIEERLVSNFSPEFLEVKNQSHLHAGHAGDDGSGESHFKLIIQSDILNAEARVARERMVHKALGDLMGKIHALSVQFIKK